MFCMNCGKEIENDSAFCMHCGSAQNAIYSQCTVFTKQGGERTTVEPMDRSVMSNKKSFKWWHFLLMTAGVIFLIVVIVLIIGIFSDNNKGSSNNDGILAGIEDSVNEDSFFAINPQSKYGAKSLDELKEILYSDFVFTEDQVNCMTTAMLMYSLSEIGDYYDELGGEFFFPDIVERENKFLTEEFNNNFFKEWKSEKIKFKIQGLHECNIDFYEGLDETFVEEEISKAPDEREKEIYKEFYDIVMYEKNNIEKVWKADALVIGESGVTTEINASDYSDYEQEHTLYVFKIGGRYFWSFIEMY